MIRRFIFCFLAFGMLALPLSAKDNKKETDRLENCGTVSRKFSTFPMTSRKTCSTKRNASSFFRRFSKPLLSLAEATVVVR